VIGLRILPSTMMCSQMSHPNRPRLNKPPLILRLLTPRKLLWRLKSLNLTQLSLYSRLLSKRLWMIKKLPKLKLTSALPSLILLTAWSTLWDLRAPVGLKLLLTSTHLSLRLLVMYCSLRLSCRMLDLSPRNIELKSLKESSYLSSSPTIFL